MRHILASLTLLVPLALAACGGNPDRKETVIIQQPAQMAPAQPQSQTIVVPPGSTVRTCTTGTYNCP